LDYPHGVSRLLELQLERQPSRKKYDEQIEPHAFRDCLSRLRRLRIDSRRKGTGTRCDSRARRGTRTCTGTCAKSGQ
jgi:hypothetical protein